MDGQRPAATTVAHCVGAFTNIARTAQDFHSAGLPIWFIQPQKSWNSPISCNILEVVSPLNPASSLCVSEHDPPFSPIFRGFATTHEKHGAIHGYSRQWLVFKDPFQGEHSKGNLIHLGATCFLTLPTASTPLAIKSVGAEKVSPEHSQPTGQGSSSSCESDLSSHSIFSYCRLSKPQSLKTPKLVVATNSFHWRVILRRSQFLPGKLHLRPSTDLRLISLKHTSRQHTMAIMSFLTLVFL